MKNKPYTLIPQRVCFHTSLLEDSVYEPGVLNLVQEYFYERVGIDIEFRLANGPLGSMPRPSIHEIGIDDRVRMLMKERGLEGVFERLKGIYEEAYHSEGFSEIREGGILLVSFPFEKIRFDIAKGSKLDHSTVIGGVRVANLFEIPKTAYEYTQDFASKVANAISQFAGVVPSNEDAEDLAEDHEGNVILNPNSIDPSAIKYHFFFRDSQKAKMREFFSNL